MTNAKHKDHKISDIDPVAAYIVVNRGDGSVSVLSVLGCFRRRWLSLFLLVLVGGTLGWVSSLFWETRFEAHVTVSVGSEGTLAIATLGVLEGLGSAVGVQDRQDRRAEALALLESPSFLGKFLTQFSSQDVDSLTPEELYALGERFLDDNLRIRRNVKLGTYEISVRAAKPHEASQLANSLVEYVNDYIRARHLSQANRLLHEINRELKATNQIALRNALYAMAERALRDKLEANVQSEYVFRVIQEATPPSTPSWPKPVILILAGVLLGALAWLIYAATCIASEDDGPSPKEEVRT